jgi:hypothetical protein
MLLTDNFHEVYQEWKHKKSVSAAAERCKLVKSTYYLKGLSVLKAL